MYDSWHISQNKFCLTARSSMPPVNMRVVPQIRRQNNNWLRSSNVSYSMLHNRKRL